MDLDLRSMAQNGSELLLGLGFFFWSCLQVIHWEEEREERNKVLQQSNKPL